MEFLSDIGGNLPWIGVLCALLCVGLVILSLVMQFLDIFLGIVGAVFSLLFGVLEGGPIAWIGCLFLILGCAVCGLLVALLGSALATCGTPDAMNICRILGY